jgi:hypothetical protein
MSEMPPHTSSQLAEAWNNDPSIPNVGPKPDALGGIGALLSLYLFHGKLILAPFLPVIKPTDVAAGQPDHPAKAMKERPDMFFEGIPVFMKALDEVKALYPFIGGALILWCSCKGSDPWQY